MFYRAFDLIMAVIYLLTGIYFYNSKGKAAKFLSGYTKKIKSDDFEKELCELYGKRIMIWSLIFIAGLAVDVFNEGIGCFLAWITWIIFFIYHLIDRSKREMTKK